jgi:hypothetical protein
MPCDMFWTPRVEWIVEEGWPVLLEREKNNKQTPEVNEISNKRNTFDHNLLGLFDQQVFSTKVIYSPTEKTIDHTDYYINYVCFAYYGFANCECVMYSITQIP